MNDNDNAINISDIQHKLSKARTQILLKSPFLAGLILRCPLVEASDKVETMATDGKNIYYNNKFVDKMSLPILMGTIAHEICHNAFGHTFRTGNREHDRWNEACDYAINPLILDDFKMELPEGILYSFEFTGQSAEIIYDKLKKRGEEPKNPSWGGMLPPSVEDKQLESAWKLATVQAAMSAKSKGSLPSRLAKYIADVSEPVVNWKSALRDYFTAKVPEDFAWYPPHQQYLAMGIHYPSLSQDSLGEIVVAVDTSGSITDNEFKDFLGEISAILGDCNPSKVHLMQCDTQVQSVVEFTAQDLPMKDVELRGRGGTDFRPVFEYIESNEIQPQVLVFMTDMYGDFPMQAPDYPTIWLRTSRRDAPFGECINFN
jgi:predicted metal-dependent peptidase